MEEFAGRTALHPLGLAAIIVLGIAVLVLPRRYAVLPFLIMACFISPAQRIVIGGADFNMLRIMVVFGAVRLMSKGELRGFRMTNVDGLLIAWAVSSTFFYVLREGTTAAMINRFGAAFDALGMYFVFRGVIRTWADADRVIQGFIIVSVPVALLFLVEHATARNLFSIFGGVPQITAIREGRLRCQGAFPHPIMAGVFWATLMPLITARYWRSRNTRQTALVGMGSAIVIVYAVASSTPIIGVAVGIVGGCMFMIRQLVPMIVAAIPVVLLMLHIVMDKPVWHLLARVNVVGGSTGWHRYKIIDESVNHFGEWWLMGTNSTRHWARNMADVTNQFVLEGVRGGVFSLMFFNLMIGAAFYEVWVLVRNVRGDPARSAYAWAFGVALLAHCASFLAVSYFGQIKMIWYLLLAMIASMGVHEKGRIQKQRQIRRAQYQAQIAEAEASHEPSPA